MFICIKKRTTSLIFLDESTTLLLSAKQNIFNPKIDCSLEMKIRKLLSICNQRALDEIQSFCGGLKA